MTAFDCVIVGARCAGAPLAIHLARVGMKVGLVDSAKLPSGQAFSTHAILPAGMDYLDELGIGARIRAVAPPVRASSLAIGRARLDLVFPPGREMFCPRRTTLDPILLDAAVTAGAEVRDETAVVDLVREGDRVVGARTRHRGVTSDLRAPIVVGADGRNSTVARLVGAAEYHVLEGPRGGYWTYFPATAAFDRLPFQTYIEMAGPAARFAFRTDGDLVIAGAFDARATARRWRADLAGEIRRQLESSDVLRTVVDGNEPAVPFVGLLKGSSFFRQAAGPGWALVGDAGLHKDPTPGYGITDALRDAKALSGAVLDGRPAAYEIYWRERDVKSVPLFAQANAMGSLDYANPFNELVLDRAGRDPAIVERLRRTTDRTLTPFEAIPAWRVFGWALAALGTGRFEIWPHFLKAAGIGRWVDRERRARERLVEEARRKLDSG